MNESTEERVVSGSISARANAHKLRAISRGNGLKGGSREATKATGTDRNNSGENIRRNSKATKWEQPN
ncbi:hypothetical protein [Borrelia sp. RT5S]|uniref:hypothetical protein n=1 Tax=Borrelia sp. RT5S TaxID=2898581 RepID=UPI001E45DFC2|nr:hypothetical protein [Borrelia sp. RT5S]UGQ16629.1 hypothetical protein LSO06_04620 [Borrelia sp. RT5S]